MTAGSASPFRDQTCAAETPRLSPSSAPLLFRDPRRDLQPERTADCASDRACRGETRGPAQSSEPARHDVASHESAPSRFAYAARNSQSCKKYPETHAPDGVPEY